jgi:hypothetical protein
MPKGEWQETGKWWFREKIFDWIWDHLKNAAWFRAMIVQVLSVVTGLWNRSDPRWLYGAIGAFLAATLILLPTGIQALIRLRYGIRPVVPRELPLQFRKFSSVSILGWPSAAFSDIEHEWDQCNKALRSFIAAWNQMSDFDAITNREGGLSEEEKTYLARQQFNQGKEGFHRASDLFLDRVEQLHRCAVKFIVGDQNSN